MHSLLFKYIEGNKFKQALLIKEMFKKILNFRFDQKVERERIILPLFRESVLTLQ